MNARIYKRISRLFEHSFSYASLTSDLNTKNYISASQAKEIYMQYSEASDAVYSATLSRNEPIIKMAYLQIGDTVHTVWVCSEENGYGNHVFIDAKTGEQIIP